MALAKELNLIGILSSKEIENKANEDADNNARGNWKVQIEATSLDVDITRQMPEPWDFSAECKQRSKGNDYDSQNDQSPAELRHKVRSRWWWRIQLLLFRTK
jgi:hypothetical protein